MRYSWIIFWMICYPLASSGQLQVKSFDELDSLQKVTPRNIVVFIHTDWCKYCLSMLNTTFKDSEIVKTINNEFYFADLNAETEEEIVFNNYIFKYLPSGRKTGVHELALQLGSNSGQVVYPTLCILNADYEIVFQYSQLLNSESLLNILRQFL